MNENILEYLRRLYDDSIAQSTLQHIQKRIDRQKQTYPSHDTFDFSEQDVILITYGDSIQAKHQTPLQSLHQFAVDHLKDIISTIHILPFYPFSSDDGFSIIDYYEVNPQLGTWDDIKTIREDFTLMFDAVFNHMSAQSHWFKAFLKDDPQYMNTFRTESTDTDLSSVTRPRSTPVLTKFTKKDGQSIHVWTTFSADQVDLDISHPDTLLRLLDILFFYVTKGAYIIRLDAIAYLWKEAGTSCIHLPQTHATIKLMRAYLDEVAPHVMLITETNVPHLENISYFGKGYDEAQMVYNFTLPPLLFHTLQSGDATKLTRWVNTLKTPSKRCIFFNFTASHDGIGVRPVEGILDDDELEQLILHTEACGGKVSYKQNSDGSQSPYELNITYVDAIIDPSQSIEWQIKRFLLSQAIALTLSGIPAIYIHSLLGSRNDHENIRKTGRVRSINRAQLSFEALNDELHSSGSFRSLIFNNYLQLIKIRTQQPALHPSGSQQAVDTGNPSLFCLLRISPDSSQRILAIYNVADQKFSYALLEYINSDLIDVITGERLSHMVELPPYGFRWIQV